MDVHELTAGYALDALDPAERETFEEHLSSCERCREELQGFWQVSGALAYAADGPMPPASLRGRILEQARSERSNVVPLRRSPLPRSGAVLGRGRRGGGGDRARHLGDVALERPRRSRERARRARAPGRAHLPERRREGRPRRDPERGRCARRAGRSTPAPAGKDYEIWVFEDGVPQRAGLFQQPGVALLTRQVEPGQMVAVTLEPDGGLDAPSGAPLITASAA